MYNVYWFKRYRPVVTLTAWVLMSYSHSTNRPESATSLQKKKTESSAANQHKIYWSCETLSITRLMVQAFNNKSGKVLSPKGLVHNCFPVITSNEKDERVRPNNKSTGRIIYFFR